jgi:lipopolysaccharide transport system permease protein
MSRTTLELEPESADAAALPASSVEPASLVTVIERRPGWKLVDFPEVWKYRELLLFLTWRDVQVRYKQTVLGAAWAILQPLSSMIVFSIFFGKLANLPAGDLPYPLFVLAGVLPWTFFSNALGSAGNSLVGNHDLVKKVYFPRLFIPLGAVGAGLVDLAISFMILIGMMAWFRIPPTWGMLLVPVLIAGLGIAALGVGITLSALMVAYRDVRFVMGFLIQAWMLCTPCIYMDAGEVIGPTGQMLLPLNPAYGLIVNFRQAVLGGSPDWYSLGISLTVGLAFLVGGCLYFRRVERSFADII